MGNGSLHAAGSAALAGLSPQRLDATVRADQLPITAGPVGLFLDAEADLHGEKTAPRTFAGKVTLTRGSARLPKLAGGRRLQPLGPLPDVVFVDERALRERARHEAARAGPSLHALIAAHVPGPFHVRSPEIDADFKGDLQLALAAPATTLSGSIEAEGGWVEILGRRYEVEHARFGFGGEAPPDPALDVRITRQVSDAQIIVEVHGTAKRPELALASEPPIYDQSQIVGIIVSGDPGTQRVSDQTLESRAVGALSSLVVGKLKDQILPILPIDVLKVATGPGGFGGLTTTRVEVGKYLTENIYVSYVHQFGVVQIGTQRVNANQAEVQYRFKRRYEIDTSFGDAGVGAVDFFFTFRY
jgi:autotransporter translocation and assembly factor TamB